MTETIVEFADREIALDLPRFGACTYRESEVIAFPWGLPGFATLHRLLEARMGKPGKREYVQVLRLLETFRAEDVHAAVREALRLGAIGFDAVKHLVLCRIERRPPKLDLAAYPYLPRVTVATTSAEAYMTLLGGAA